MARRITHVILLFVGLAPAVWALCVLSIDPRRAAVLAALATLGLTLNAIPLAKPDFGMTVPLRVIACGVALVVAAGVMAMWQWRRREYLPGIPESDLVWREIALTASQNLLWIVAAVGYVVLTILIMPVPAGKPKPAREQPGRIDFRTCGR